MKKLLGLVERFLMWIYWLFELNSNFFADFPHAGGLHPNFEPLSHRAVAVLRASLINIKKDCIIVDVSKWQGEIDFNKLRASGVKGVIIKCGQGSALDPRFIENWRKAKLAGLKVGCYWYYDSRIAPKRQAQIWADTMKLYGFGDLPHFLDYEENYGGDYAGILDFLTFLLEFQALTGLANDRIGIYTGYYYWMQYGAHDSFWARYWMWIAWYGSEYDVIVPKPWTQDMVWGWQFTDLGDGLEMGVESRELDMNYFLKGLEVFEGMYGETGEVPPQTGEEGMFRVYSTRYGMSLREEGNINGERIQSYPIGTDFICDIVNVPPSEGGLLSDKWAHVVSINGVTVNGWVAQVHLGVVYCLVEDIGSGVNPRISVEFVDKDGSVYGADNVEMTPR